MNESKFIRVGLLRAFLIATRVVTLCVRNSSTRARPVGYKGFGAHSQLLSQSHARLR